MTYFDEHLVPMADEVPADSENMIRQDLSANIRLIGCMRSELFSPNQRLRGAQRRQAATRSL